MKDFEILSRDTVVAVWKDNELKVKEAIDKMHKDAYHIMQVMNGINPGDPTYNTDQNIETYKKTM